jgi:hypothetical protein
MGKGWAKGHYCTCFWDSLFGVEYGDICYEHDLDYSSLRPEITSRKVIDKKLRDNVMERFRNQNKSFYGIVISNLMYLGVRLFGWTYWKKW